MKIVLNKAYGGYGLEVEDEFVDFISQHADDRTNPELVKFVEEHYGKYDDLQVREIPDDATDWEIQEYDGFEEVIYVVDGKIHHT